MYGYLTGISITDDINYCPYCGAEIYISYTDGTVECEKCGKRFGVIEIDETGEGGDEID